MGPITSAANPLIKQIRALSERKARDRTQLHVIEGIHHVGEALEAGWPIESIVYAPDLLVSEFGGSLIDRARRAGVPVLPVTAGLIERISGKDNPQGILAVARHRLTDLEQARSIARGVALVNPQDPGNLGAILRTIDAAGVDALFLLHGGVDAFHPTAVRASMGALFWKPVIQTSFEDLATYSRAAGCQLVGTTARVQASVGRAPIRSPWILVMGSEQKGLSPQHLQACDTLISLPMRGRVSSLNLAVAAGILLYQLIESDH